MDQMADLLGKGAAANPPQEKLLHILRVACRLFAERGVDGASMRDIAAESGVSKATLYHYFADKDAIVRPVVLGTTKAIYEHVLAHHDPASPPLQQLRVFLVETAVFFEKFRWAWIAGSFVFWSDPQLRQRQKRVEWRDKYEALLRGILEAAIVAGEIRPLDVSLMGRFVVSPLSWLPRWYNPAGPMTAPEIAEQFYDMLIGGLMPRDTVGDRPDQNV